MEIFKFVTLKEIPFTIDLYNEFKGKIVSNDTPYENLIELDVYNSNL